MSLPPNHVSLPGSHREPFRNACSAGARSADERLEVTVVLKSPQSTANQELLAAQPADRSTARPASISRVEFAKTYGARMEDVEKVEKFAAERHLTVVRSDAVRRSIMLSGTVAQFNAAFGVSLEHFEYDGGTYRGRTGPVTMPTEVVEVVEAVLGLDDRPQAVTHLRPHAGPRSLSPLDVARLYNVPPKLDGSGQCLALIELEGGYRPADLSTYFHQLGISPPPTVKSISVDGAKNAPTGNPDGPDGEVMLDIEIAGAVAPRATIAVYFAPNTDRGFLDAITKATHDAQLNPAVISISWGGPESQWTAQAMTALNNALADAARLGVTVCVAAGDSGSSDGLRDGKNHVDFPASSPFALACGGTRLVSTGGGIASETVWNDGPTSATGGGFSAFFARPAYQAQLNAPGTTRGLPDVAGNADPQTGYRVRVDGVDSVVGGTSAVAPLWAGFTALWNQATGSRAGLLHPLLYLHAAHEAGAFQDITHGNNGSFSAGPGWDACSGWGTPDVSKLLSVIEASQSAQSGAAAIGRGTPL